MSNVNNKRGDGARGGVGGVGKNWKAPAEAVGKKLSDDW